MILETNLLLAVAAVQALVLGFVSTELARHSGPKGVKNASVVALIVSFVLGIVLSTSSMMLFGALAFAVPTALFSWWYGQKIVANGIHNQLALAPQVVNFLSRNYERLADKDGITAAGLHIALDERQFDYEECQLVSHILYRMSDIGHVIDTIVMSAGGMHGAAAVAVYGINRQDIRTYEARLTEKYQRWLTAAK